MAKSTNDNHDPIQDLLQERTQYSTWLARLDAASDSTPGSVRDRVRGDYQKRLEKVVEELRSHAGDVNQQLDHHRETREELVTREDQAREIMAEAELRHTVGEYSEEKWQQIQGEAQRNLTSIREELSGINEKILELEKVQAQIAEPLPGAENPAPAPEPEAQPEAPAAEAGHQPAEPEAPPVTQQVEERKEPPASPPPAAAEPARPAARQTDELAFLKSVTEDDRAGPSPRRASGGVPRPVEASPQGPSRGSLGQPTFTRSSTLGNTGPTSIPDARERPSQAAPRTLKCGECGTMNRPTEWYCERCGAELADL